MIFSRSAVDLPSPLLILDKVIERKQEARFLGVIVDESLSWSKHVKTIQSKMSHHVAIHVQIKQIIATRC